MASKSKPQKSHSPVVVRHNLDRGKTTVGMVLPAVIASTLFNGAIIGLMFLLPAPSGATTERNEQVAQSETPDTPPPKDPFATGDEDPAAQEFDTDINYRVERKGPESVP